MLHLDKWRAAAKRHAWYDDPDSNDPSAFPNYNPFRKRRTRNKQIGDEEGSAYRARTNRSENFATTEMDAQRISKNLDGEGVPRHANTMPISSIAPSSSGSKTQSPIDAPISDVKDMAPDPQSEVDHEREKNSSQDSDPVSGDTIVASTGGKPRRRKFPFIGKKGRAGGGSEDRENPRRQSSLFRKDPQKFTAVGQFKATILNSYINILLVFVPIGIAVNFANVPKVGVFVINFIAIIPLAAMLSYATEEIALRVGETLGGLLNATFG